VNGAWMLPVLIAGIYLAVKLTIFFNYIAYGQTAERLKKKGASGGTAQKPENPESSK